MFTGKSRNTLGTQPSDKVKDITSSVQESCDPAKVAVLLVAFTA